MHSPGNKTNAERKHMKNNNINNKTEKDWRGIQRLQNKVYSAKFNFDDR